MGMEMMMTCPSKHNGIQCMFEKDHPGNFHQSKGGVYWWFAEADDPTVTYRFEKEPIRIPDTLLPGWCMEVHPIHSLMCTRPTHTGAHRVQDHKTRKILLEWAHEDHA